MPGVDFPNSTGAMEKTLSLLFSDERRVNRIGMQLSFVCWKPKRPPGRSRQLNIGIRRPNPPHLESRSGTPVGGRPAAVCGLGLAAALGPLSDGR
jgi:hypothetical protein